MATKAAGKLFRDFMRKRVISTSVGAYRHCSSAATSAPKIPHSSKKGRLLTGATIGLIIAGGAYVSTVDEATFCGWLFSATKLVNPFFALLDAEVAHTLAVSAAARGWVPREKRPDPPILGLEVWGRKFSNPIGLSAGFDKNAEAVEGLLGMGFGFVEVGSVTPVPQEGNPKPRIFRLRQEGAIINRCGFNSEGIVAVAKRLGAQHGKRKLETSSSSSPSSDEANHGGKAGPGILGVNLGKNKTSDAAAADYVQGVHTLSQYADYLQKFDLLNFALHFRQRFKLLVMKCNGERRVILHCLLKLLQTCLKKTRGYSSRCSCPPLGWIDYIKHNHFKTRSHK